MGKYGAFPGGMGNMQNLMKQAAKLQEDLKRKQDQAAAAEFEVSAGGGAILVKATGDKIIKEIKIKPEVVDKDDVEMLEDLVLTAVNEALKKADDMMKDSMGGFNIPGIM
jgi:DNA-binding YbaB/EbfC family protein